jgi:hypothetical protein
MKIRTYEVPENENFSRNFLDTVNPDVFQKEEEEKNKRAVRITRDIVIVIVIVRLITINKHLYIL